MVSTRRNTNKTQETSISSASNRDEVPSASNLRIALFSGNYNYVKDGANQALNKLVAFLEAQGAAVRVYSPTSSTPAFKPAGTLISVPSIPIPLRDEYRLAIGLPRSIIRDLDRFNPNIVHISAPDILGQKAISYARKRSLPVVASVHTRFEKYLSYYRLGWLEKYLESKIAKVYNSCDEIFIPTPCMEDILRDTGVIVPMKTWTRGIDLDLYSPTKRDESWRQKQGFAKDDVVITFVGRVVLEKGLDTFADALDILIDRGVKFKTLVIGEGPKREWFTERMPHAQFLGFQSGEDLARAYASSDIFFNPSNTETFGNVTLEAMASGVAQVCAQACGSQFLVVDGETGYLAPHDDAPAFAEKLEMLITDKETRQKFSEASIARGLSFNWRSVLGQVISHYQELLSLKERAH
ncbi:glycosyl hydrolase [Kordiimonas sediminis]|uniref:Glycosyl hydrolase n=1 Tax=Kordiimonas sediminis TaxID=1735581 RepID=A0A919AJD9_9PROT|nr:glycosyltransferase family 1 protein [Kordiimonas sediminis]GHF10798.1 glycosyl hydrolase [Kordiimonas sediminis]